MRTFFPWFLPRKKTCYKTSWWLQVSIWKGLFLKLAHFPKMFGVKIRRMPRKLQFFSGETSHLGTGGSPLVKCFTVSPFETPQKGWANFAEPFWVGIWSNKMQDEELNWIRLTWRAKLVSHISQMFFGGQLPWTVSVIKASCHWSWWVSSHSSPPYLVVPKKIVIDLASLKSSQPVSSKKSFTMSPICI